MDDPSTFLEFKYGAASDQQFLRVHLPPPLPRIFLHPVVVIIHGGFWKDEWTIDNAAHMTLAPSLTKPVENASGPTGAYAAIEVEYRRRGHPGGGYPGTQEDVLASLAFLRTLVDDEGLPLDLAKLVVVGHSAGGMLALWAAEEAARAREGRSCAGGSAACAAPAPILVVGLAPVTDMISAYERKLSDEGDAAEQYMKCAPFSLSELGGSVGGWGVPVASGSNLSKWREASPLHRLPSRIPALVVAGTADTDVPFDMVEAYRDRAHALASPPPTLFLQPLTQPASPLPQPHVCAPVQLIAVEGADHYSLVDATSEGWALVRREIDAAVFGSRTPSASLVPSHSPLPTPQPPCERRPMLVATRVHQMNASRLVDMAKLEEFLVRAVTEWCSAGVDEECVRESRQLGCSGDCGGEGGSAPSAVAIAVGAEGGVGERLLAEVSALAEDVQGRFPVSRVRILVLPVAPWGKFVNALNALVQCALSERFEHILFSSVETAVPRAGVEALRAHMTTDDAVVGAAFSGHSFGGGSPPSSPGSSCGATATAHVPLDGRTSPWNTLALWHAPTLALTGFLGVAEGCDIEHDRRDGGVEEVTAIATLQHLAPHRAGAKLIRGVPGLAWSTDFEGDEERRAWHARKMESKAERPASQMARLTGLPPGRVVHLTHRQTPPHSFSEGR